MGVLSLLMTVLAAAAPKHEDLPDGHERVRMFGVPLFDTRRAERRLARRLKRIELRRARRSARE
jgi:hypothetical protein